MATEFRVALFGKTGTGKSSVGNSLLRKKLFEFKSSSSSVSQQCQLGEAETSIGRLLVVDTPGLFDTAKPNLSTIEELIKCIGLLSPGPHVFIIVLTVDRFTRDDIESVEVLKQLLGAGTMHHLIVVFTRKDQIEDDGSTIHEFLGKVPDFLKKLLRDVNNRYGFICNRQNYRSHQQDVENVLSLIKSTVQHNSGRYYTQDVFQVTDRVIKQEVEKRQKVQNKSEMECRKDIRNDIVKNDSNLFPQLVQAICSIGIVVTPIVGMIIKAYRK